jgi:hypothetical protein
MFILAYQNFKYFIKPFYLISACKQITVFDRVICALFFSILAAEKSGCIKYDDFFFGGGLDLGFILV